MRSLRAYILTVTTVFAVLLIAAAAVVVRQAEASGREQAREQLLDTTRALAQVVDARLQGYVYLLGALAASDAMARRDIAGVEAQARAALSDSEAWITLSNRQGEQLINTGLAPGAALPKGGMPEAIWRELDTGQPRLCNLAQGLVEARVLCVDLPIMEDGRAAYKLSVIFRPHLLQRIIEAQHVPASRFATIIDREGTVIWRNVKPEQFVGTSATPDLLRRLRTAREGTTLSQSLEGVPTQVAFAKSPVSGWTFIIAIPRHQITASAREAFRGGALVALLLIGAALLVALNAAHAVAGDIRRLAGAARRIGAGEPLERPDSRFEEFAAVNSLLAEAIAERDASRERFDLAQEVGGIGAWEWDSVRDEGRVSDTYKEMHGLTAVNGPLRFAQVLEVIHPDDQEGYLERLAAAKTRREPSTNEYRVIRKDGSVTWIAAKGRPIFNDAGEAIGAVGIVRDVTADHEAATAMQRLNELLAQQVEERTLERDRLWNIAHDPFVVADDQGIWLAASPAWTTLLGYPLEDFLGRTSEWLEHPDDIARTRAEDQALARGRVTERFENRFRARDGSYRWLSWTAVPEGGRFYSVARDVTAEKEQAQALAKAEAALRQSQKMESIGQITGGVAHDFNNLLMPILGTLDLLQQRGLPDERSERMVANALEAAERARMLVQRLLAFARRQPLQTQAIDLRASLRGMAPLLATTVGPNVELALDVEDDLPSVSADANQLELAILNLAVNARDAMPDGGRLTLSAAIRDFAADPPADLPPGPYVELCVTDTGVGMPESVIERAIEPFFSTKGLGRGTGLGLSMVHGLMAQLGGGMQIESRLGEGTTMKLWLRPSQAAPAAEPARLTTRPAQLGRLLLVDDEDLVRRSAGQMLSDLGYEVTEAASAQAALDLLAAGGFDLLVTDHLMPGVSGVELARTARARWPAMRVLIVSGYADVDDIAPDLPRLNKPFRQDELAAALSQLDGAAPLQS